MTAISASTSPADRWWGPLLVLAGGICVGFAPIGLRLGVGLGEDGLGPQAIAFWRYVFAAPILLSLVLIFERRLPVLPNRFVILAGTFFALDIALWHWGLTLTTVANATFIVNLGNIGVGLLAWLFLRERLTTVWLIAVAVALTGAAMLSLGGVSEGQADLRGDILAFGAALLVSGYMLCSKIARRDLGALDVLFWLTITEILVGALVTAISGEHFLPATNAGWRAPLALAIVAHCAGQGFIIAGIGRTPASLAGVLVLVQPVVAAMISWQLFNEPLLAIQLAGASLILLGVGLSQIRAPTKTRDA
ncbi:MAG: DMT family transporter [Pseudomonadota bacterium]